MTTRTLVLALILCLLPTLAPAGDWNDDGIKWFNHKEGLAEARRSKKPICVVVYTDWCPVCEKFSGVFHNETVIERADQFVMVKVNRDTQKAISNQYNLDGVYIPRTYFLTSQGVVAPKIHGTRDDYKYFLNPSSPDSLLARMQTAIEKLD